MTTCSNPGQIRPLRVGVDLLGVQSPYSRGRGIGRYSECLIRELVKRGPRIELHLYSRSGLPDDLRAPQSIPKRFVAGAADGCTLPTLQKIVDRNPDRLDCLLLTSPLDLFHASSFPPRRPTTGGLRLCSIVYDLIPYLFHESYLYNSETGEQYYRRLRCLKSYDSLFAISESTRKDCLRLLGVSPETVIAIGSATDPGFGPGTEPDAQGDARLTELGIVQPFVFCVPGMDARKNVAGTIEAFSLLPEPVRSSHQLVLTCWMSEADQQFLRGLAAEAGVADRLVLTNHVSDATLKHLYHRCAAFLFASHYEGFGLPLLEAMACGAAVVGGNNSSQPQIIGDAGLLANSHDALDVARKLEWLLAYPGLALALGRAAAHRAKQFTWRVVADRLIDGLANLVDHAQRQPALVNRLGSRQPSPRILGIPRKRRARKQNRPTLAFFGPLPPLRSGIALYSQNLIRRLANRFDITIFHDTGNWPMLAADPHFPAFDYRAFPRLNRIHHYDVALHQLGNSLHHSFQLDVLEQVPGIVVLHDVSLAGLQALRSKRSDELAGRFRSEVESEAAARGLMKSLCSFNWSANVHSLEQQCLQREILLNRSVLQAAEKVVVTNSHAEKLVLDSFPEMGERVSVIPLPVASVAGNRSNAQDSSAGEIRRRLALDQDATLIGVFGILSAQKYNLETIDAFARITNRHPKAQLLFVGRDLGEGIPTKGSARASELGVRERVRFLGHQDDLAYQMLVRSVDVGIACRRSPTRGESSLAALELLSAGVPTIVTDTEAFIDLPEEVALKVPEAKNIVTDLAVAMDRLLIDAPLRASLRRSAERFIRERHSWDVVIEKYLDLIVNAPHHSRWGESAHEQDSIDGSTRPAPDAACGLASDWPAASARASA